MLQSQKRSIEAMKKKSKDLYLVLYSFATYTQSVWKTKFKLITHCKKIVEIAVVR